MQNTKKLPNFFNFAKKFLAALTACLIASGLLAAQFEQVSAAVVDEGREVSVVRTILTESDSQRSGKAAAEGAVSAEEEVRWGDSLGGVVVACYPCKYGCC